MSSRLDGITDWAKEARRARYSAAEMAALCEVSDSQLRRYFGRVFGKPPQHWLNELRLCHAARLLCSGLQNKDVAHQLHFANAEHLEHRFKEYFGCRPSEVVMHYRQQQKDQMDELMDCFGKDFPRSLLPSPPWEIAERNLCWRNTATHSNESD